MWNDQLRVNLRCNQELAADRSRDEPQLAHQCAQLDLPVLILHGADDPRPVWPPIPCWKRCPTRGGS